MKARLHVTLKGIDYTDDEARDIAFSEACALGIIGARPTFVHRRSGTMVVTVELADAVRLEALR